MPAERRCQSAIQNQAPEAGPADGFVLCGARCVRKETSLMVALLWEATTHLWFSPEGGKKNM